VQVAAGNGGARTISGSVVNLGMLQLETSATIGGAGLRVVNGGHAVVSSGTLNVVGAFSSEGTGQLDLGNTQLFITYGESADPVDAVRGYLHSGYAGGAWNGAGIVSSLADAAHGLGEADSADGAVGGMSANTLLVRLTVFGDANLDGTTTFSDLLLLAQHYGRPAQHWTFGDFDYDGIVGFSDLLKLAQNYGRRLRRTA
jgi:hypothetical protein